MSNETKDKYADFIETYKLKHDCYPLQAEIARGVTKDGVSRQAVRNYFTKNKKTLIKIPEYKRYF